MWPVWRVKVERAYAVPPLHTRSDVAVAGLRA
jgi:hypothetical protein